MHTSEGEGIRTEFYIDDSFSNGSRQVASTRKSKSAQGINSL